MLARANIAFDNRKLRPYPIDAVQNRTIIQDGVSSAPDYSLNVTLHCFLVQKFISNELISSQMSTLALFRKIIEKSHVDVPDIAREI